MSGYQVYILDKYLFKFSPSMKVSYFQCEDYYGISFIIEDGFVDVVCNKHLGNRLTYNLKSVGWHDIPFKSDTFGYLPEGIEVLEIG
jgi:hypothetical protein